MGEEDLGGGRADPARALVHWLRVIARGLGSRMTAAILFDFHDTLATYHERTGEVEARVLAELGFAFTPETVNVAMAEVVAYWNGGEPLDQSAYSHSRAGYNAFQRTIHESWLRRLGLDPDHPELFDRLCLAWDDPERVRLFDDSLPALEGLRTAGYRLGVVSNWTWGLREILAAHGVLPLLDCVIISAQAGYRKPHPRIYAAALDALGLPPSEVLFVGDSPYADVHGPLAAGMTPVHIDRHGAHAPIPGVARITSLHELAALLRVSPHFL